MSIEIHNPHIVNSLVADAHRQRIKGYPKPRSTAPAVEALGRRTAPIVQSFQTTAAAKIMVGTAS